MSNVTNRVTTQFTANIGQAVSGFNTVSSVASRVSGALGSLTSMLNPLNLAIGGLSVGGAIAGITALGGAFEQTQNTLAGTLGALGIAGGADPTERFRNGLGLAAETMERIEIAAAALPGEAEDYIQVFRAGLPVLQASVGGTLEDMTTFSNRFTAIGRTFGVDAMQLGADLQRLLRAGRGGAGMDVRTFQQLLPFLRTVEGQANITSESFNRMTAPERFRVLNQAFDSLGPMLEQAGGTFDSMSGALTSTMRSLTRQVSAPLFDGIKESLGEINALFSDSEGNATELSRNIVSIGQSISRYIVEGVRAANAGIQAMGRSMRAFASSRAFTILVRAAERLAGAASVLGRPRPGATGGAAAAGMAGAGVAAAGLGGALATGPGALVAAMAGGVADFLTRTEAVNGVLEQMVGIVDSATRVFTPMVQMISTSNDLFGDLIQGVLPGVLSAFQAILDPLITFWNGLMVISNEIFESLNPVFESLFNAVGNLFQSIGDFLNPALRIVGRVFLVLYEVLAFVLTPVIEAVVGLFAMLVDAISEFISWLGSMLESVAGALEDSDFGNAGTRGDPEEAPSLLADILAALNDGNATDDRAAAEEAAANAATRTTPSARGGARTTQDFRYSRFDITQRFAEGFDPDRIAVAFADDLGRAGTERLQSGLEPLFGVR